MQVTAGGKVWRVLILLALLALYATACAAPAPGLASPAATPQPALAPSRPAAALDAARRVTFENISLAQGLSQSSVMCILQDRQGFMWFGTEDGLNKYDGYNFVVYRHDPDNANSLADNMVQALWEDRAGGLWVGTFARGLDRYDRETGQFIHFSHRADDPTSVAADSVKAIYEDRAGALWIGTTGGLDRLDVNTRQFVHYTNDPDHLDSLSNDVVQYVLEDSTGTLWIGTARGLNRFDRDTGTFVRYRYDPADPRSLSGDAIGALYEDSAGTLWIGTSGGLNRFEPSTGQFVRYAHDQADPRSLGSNTVLAIVEDWAGVLWVGADNGLNALDRVANRFIRHVHDPADAQSLSNNAMLSAYRDRAGGVWFGTFGGGINKLDRFMGRFALYGGVPGDPQSPTNELVFSICQDRAGMLWAGTENGLYRLDRAKGEWTHYLPDPNDPASLSHRRVWSLLEDSAGTLWVGTYGGGLDRLDPGSDGFIHYKSDPTDPYSLNSDTVLTVYEDRAGVVWVGTSWGLARLDREKGQFQRYSPDPDAPDGLSAGMVWAICEDQAGVLWVGLHGGGLNGLDRATGKFVHYNHDPEDAQSVSDTEVLALHEDAAGTLWLGTYGGGLNRFDRDKGTFTHYRAKDGLPNEVIYGILEDDAGRLWLSTNRGISRFDPSTSTFRNYDVSDGLQSNEFNVGAHFKSSDGEMFFGGIRGVNAFYPDQVQENTAAPSIVLTSLSQGAETMELRQPAENLEAATFHWPNNLFEFEFAALNYAQHDKNQYAYKLEGFDRDWHYIGTKRFGRYTNLPGRSYILRLKGSNNDGVWNEEGAALKITVVPPFWATWWFRGLAAAMMVGGAFAGYRVRVRDIEARNLTLAGEVEQRTREIEQRRQDLEALFLADHELDRHVRLDEVLQALVDIGVDILGADKSALLCWDRHRERLVMHLARNFSPQGMSTLNFAPGEGVIGHVMETGEPAVIEDPSSDPLWANQRPEIVEAIRAEGIASFMHLPIRIDSEAFGVFNVSYTQPRRLGERELRLFTALAQRAGLAIETARHFDAEQRRAEQFRVISEVGRHITSILDVDELLREIVRTIKGTFGYYSVTIGLIEGDEVVFKAGHKTDWGDTPFMPAALTVGGQGITAWVAAHGEPLLVNDVSKDPRYVLYLDSSETRSELCVPLKTKDDILGVFNVESDQLNAFDESDITVLQSLANQAAIAIENARLYGGAQEQAAVEERNRLARELHDAVTQTLFSVSLIAEALPATWENDQVEGRQLLQDMRQLSRGALAEMRTLLLELRPAALAEARLPDLLRQLVEATSGRIGVPVALNVDCPCDLHEEVRVVFYRIAQEALNNVVKHSRATQVDVSLRCNETPAGKGGACRQGVALRVSDNGRGFDPAGVPPNHLGLDIIRERVQAIGATLSVESRPGHGTVVTVTWTGPG